MVIKKLIVLVRVLLGVTGAIAHTKRLHKLTTIITMTPYPSVPATTGSAHYT